MPALVSLKMPVLGFMMKKKKRYKNLGSFGLSRCFIWMAQAYIFLKWDGERNYKLRIPWWLFKPIVQWLVYSRETPQAPMLTPSSCRTIMGKRQLSPERKSQDPGRKWQVADISSFSNNANTVNSNSKYVLRAGCGASPMVSYLYRLSPSFGFASICDGQVAEMKSRDSQWSGILLKLTAWGCSRIPLLVCWIPLLIITLQ